MFMGCGALLAAAAWLETNRVIVKQMIINSMCATYVARHDLS